MLRALKARVGRLAPGVEADRRRLREVADGVGDLRPGLDGLRSDVDGLKDLVHQVDLRVNHFQQFDFRLQKLRDLAAEVEPYQPAYGLPDLISAPARDSVDRCRALENHFAGTLRGARLLDVGSSLGYVCFYFGDRGVRATGWELSPRNVEVARLIGELNGVPATFRTAVLDPDSVSTIVDDQFDVVTLLSVLHHVVHHQGLRRTQELVRDLLAHIPVMVLELARKGEDPDLFWDAALPDDELAVLDLVRDEVDVVAIGEFGTHLSDTPRTLYVVSRRGTVEVNGRRYAYDRSRGEAHQGSQAVEDHEPRHYYWGEGVFIKRYTWSEPTSDNARLLLREAAALHEVRGVPGAPELLDVHIGSGQGTIVMSRQVGRPLDAGVAMAPEEVVTVVRDIASSLAPLHDRGLFHNDVRSWNILWDGQRAALVDYADVSARDFDGDLTSLLWVAHSLVAGRREPSEQGKTALPPREALPADLHGWYDQVAGGARRVSDLT